MTNVDPGYGVPIEVKPPSRKGYRYVRAVKTDTIIFVLAEMEVYGFLSGGDEVSGDYEDVIGTKYASALALMQGIDAATPVSEVAYGVNNLLNRAEAVSDVKRVFSPGFDYTSDMVLPFGDVTPTHPFYHEISAGYKLGYTKGNGDGTFTPDRFVTQQEFITMVLRGLGYEQKLSGHPNYSAGIATLSRELNLLKNVTARGDGLLSHGDAMLILYNALLASRMNLQGMQDDYLLFERSENTALEDIYGISLYQGIVKENGLYRLSGAVKKADHRAQVGELSLADPKDLLKDLLGKNAWVGMHKDEPERVMMAWADDRNNEVTVSAKELITTLSDAESGKLVTMSKDGDVEKYNFSDSVDVIYNGAPNPGFEAADLLINTGSIKMLDNNRDNVYDVLFVDAYKMDFVLGAFTNEDTISQQLVAGIVIWA